MIGPFLSTFIVESSYSYHHRNMGATGSVDSYGKAAWANASSWLIRLLIAGAVNACAGALASFILWATYTSSNFASMAWTPPEIAASLTADLSGVSAGRGLMHEHTVAVKAEKSQGVLNEATKEYLDAVGNALLTQTVEPDKPPQNNRRYK